MAGRGHDDVVRPGDRIDRYFVLETLGQGGMGVVVLALDPQLDRKVAIKLLHPKTRRKDEGRKRLLREAQAMASLSHPNVIGVHDVGVWGEHVFVAMEYVHGITLGTYAAQRPKVDELLAVFVAAGRGLGAAHEAGLVHRDFKPDNVMIAEDGRVLVLDFGLARAAHSSVYSPSEASDEDVGGSGLDSLTAAGEVMGTPMYMAPEQHTGEATPASDQYAFCVALYEALAGERPFQATDLYGLAAEKVRFAARPFPARLPRRLRAALRRGLQADPHQRFASMDDLLEALEGRRLDPLAIGAGLAVAGVAVLGVLALHGADADPCAAAGSTAVAWDDARRDAVQQALLATGVPYAVETTHTVLDEIDAHVEALASAHREACKATHVAHAQSEAILDLRVACLDRRTDELAALVAVLEQADRDVIEHAVAAAGGLDPVASCEHAQRDVLPGDPATRAEVHRLFAEVASAAARVDAGKYADALADLDRVLASAAELEHPPLRARVQLHRGEALQQLSEFEGAKAAYLAAVDVAARSGDDRTAAQAEAAAAWTIGHSLGRPDEARGHLRSAQALLERLGSPPDLHVQVLLTSGVIEHDQGGFEAALRDLEAARALQEQHEGVSPPVLTDLARVLHALGRTSEAEAMLRDAVAIAERSQGSGHPQVAKVLAHLGGLLLETGRIDDAHAAHQRELEILTAAVDEDHMLVAFALNNVAGTEIYLQRYDAARERFERARDILRRRLGAEHANVGRLTMNIGEMWRMSGDLDRALAEYEAALANLSAALGTDHPDTARCRNNVASVLYDSGRFEDAGREYGLALEALVATLGDDHPSLAYPLTGVGQSLVERGAPEDAIEPLERALALRGGDDVDPFDLGDTKLALARALWDSGRDRHRALELGRGARDAYRDAGPERTDAREQAEAWLAERVSDRGS